MNNPVDGVDATRSRESSDEAPMVTGCEPSPLYCLMCGGVQHRVVFTELDIDILRCNSCGHVFSSFRADPHYSGFWGSEVAPGVHHYWSKARARMHRDFFERFIKGRSGRLLDMGSGLGFFLKAMAAYPDWDAYGCEISPAAVRHAREHLGLKNVICSPLQDADLPRASFDIITLWDVIDHIPRPDPLLSHAHALLKRTGSSSFARRMSQPNFFAHGSCKRSAQCGPPRVLARVRSCASLLDGQHSKASGTQRFC